LDEAAVAHLRVGEHLCVIVDRAARHTGHLECLNPVLGGRRCEHRVHHLLQRGAVLHALLVGGKTRILAPFRVAQSLRTARPDLLRPRPQIAVFRPHALVGCVLAMA
jgi:hypothetical protein